MRQPFTLTTHARQAMMLRRVSMDEVLQVLSTPEVTDTDSHGQKRFFRDNLCVVAVVEQRKLIIKTVLYRYGDTWTDQDIRSRDLRK